MKATTFDGAIAHVENVLGVTLTDHVEFSSPGTFKNYSVLGSVLTVYRYAEAIGQRLVIHHLTAHGHKSHLLGTELDFDIDGRRKDPLQQVHVISDMLRIRNAMQDRLNAFRLGFYFDFLNSPDAEAAKSLQKFESTYKDVKTASSMHIGVRYRWKSEEYRGNPLGSNSLVFGVWGRGSRTFLRSDRWTRRLLDWPVGFLRAGCTRLAKDVLLDDFRQLDRYPSGYHPVDNTAGCHLRY
jgi:hypothetical protein